MKNKVVILFACLAVFSFACKKDKTPETPTPEPVPVETNKLFIEFTLDGVAKSFTSTTNSIHTGYGGGSSTSSGFFDLNKDINFTLAMPLDSIMGSDLQALVGQNIPIGSCGGCPTNIHLDYAIGANDYTSSENNNASSANYVKFNSVTFEKNVTFFDENLNQYYVTGEFNLKLSYGQDIKSVTAGKFGLIFRESKH